MLVSMVEVVGIWSRMNQFRSIRGRDQPAILGLLVMCSFMDMGRGNLQGDWLDDCEEQVRPGGKDG